MRVDFERVDLKRLNHNMHVGSIKGISRESKCEFHGKSKVKYIPPPILLQ